MKVEDPAVIVFADIKVHRSEPAIPLHKDADGPAGQVDCHGNHTARTYYATAVPFQRGSSSMRAFAVDQNGVIWYDATGAAPKPPFSETAALKRLH